MKSDLRHHIEDSVCVECGNCQWAGSADHTNEIEDLEERISPGETVPVGECPKCGCLCDILPSGTYLTVETRQELSRLIGVCASLGAEVHYVGHNVSELGNVFVKHDGTFDPVTLLRGLAIPKSHDERIGRLRQAVARHKGPLAPGDENDIKLSRPE